MTAASARLGIRNAVFLIYFFFKEISAIFVAVKCAISHRTVWVVTAQAKSTSIIQ